MITTSTLSELIETAMANGAPLEWLVVVVALCGLVYGARALSRAVTLQIAVRRRIRSGTRTPLMLRLRALKRLRDTVGLFLRHTGFLLLGWVAVLRPTPPPDPQDGYVSGVALVVVFVTAVIYDVVMAIWDDREWTWLIGIARRDPLAIIRAVDSDYVHDVAATGRQMGHLINNQIAVIDLTLTALASEPSLSETGRLNLQAAHTAVDVLATRVSEMHRRLRELDPEYAPSSEERDG